MIPEAHMDRDLQVSRRRSSDLYLLLRAVPSYLLLLRLVRFGNAGIHAVLQDALFSDTSNRYHAMYCPLCQGLRRGEGDWRSGTEGGPETCRKRFPSSVVRPTDQITAQEPYANRRPTQCQTNTGQHS